MCSGLLADSWYARSNCVERYDPRLAGCATYPSGDRRAERGQNDRRRPASAGAGPLLASPHTWSRTGVWPRSVAAGSSPRSPALLADPLAVGRVLVSEPVALIAS